MCNSQGIPDKRICGECESKYYEGRSEMMGLCPNCAHILYGYENCSHEFENGRCIKCFWNGKTSKFLSK